VVLLLDRSR